MLNYDWVSKYTWCVHIETHGFRLALQFRGAVGMKQMLTRQPLPLARTVYIYRPQ